MAKKSKGISAGNRKIVKETLNLKAPSYKWLLCRKCNYIEVEVDEKAISCVCAYCLIRACDYMPRQPKPKKSQIVVSTFEKIQQKDKKQAKLADDFKKKQTTKNGNGELTKKNVAKKKTTKKKTTKKKATKKKVTKKRK